MANTNLASMSVDALFKLHEEIAKVLSRKAAQLNDQLTRLEVRPVTKVETDEAL